MSDGLHAAASGLAAQQARMDSLANDIANVNTPGYRKGRIAFRDLAYGGVPGAEIGSGVAVGSAGRSQVAAALVESDNPLDLAIEGAGYLQVKLADGRVALTRAGGLRVDAQGALVTTGGQPLVPPVTLPPGTKPEGVVVAADGTVAVAGKKLGKIDVVDVTAPGNLQPLGGGLYLPTAASGAPATAKGAHLRQGFVESSDVDLGSAMVDMIDAQRAFELASRMVKTQDELLEIANGIRR
jgi:flagellar basal-body rod protein FlgG